MHTIHTISCLPPSDLITETTKPTALQDDQDSKINGRVYRLSKKGTEQDAVEYWLGRHNRKFEMLRTLMGTISASASSLVLLKIFGII